MKLTENQIRKIISNIIKEDKDNNVVKNKEKKVIDTRQPASVLFNYLKSLAELKAMFDLEKKHRKDGAPSWSAFVTLIETAKETEHILKDKKGYLSNQAIDNIIGRYLGVLDYEADDLLDDDMGWGVKWEDWCYPESYHEGKAKCQDGKTYLYTQIHAQPQLGIEYAGYRKWKEYVGRGPYKQLFDRLGEVTFDTSGLRDGIIYHRDFDGDPDKSKSKYFSVQEKIEKFQEIYELAIKYESVEEKQGEEMYRLFKALRKKLKSDRKLKDPKKSFYFVLEGRDKYNRYESEFYDSGNMESASGKAICGIRTYSCPDMEMV